MKECKIHGDLKPKDIKANGRCKQCHRLSANKKRDENRDWFNAKINEDRAKNPEKWEKIYKSEYQKKKAKYGNKELNAREIARRRGIKVEEYKALFNQQNGKCAICKQEERRMVRGKITNLSLDHSHKTSKNRELLCSECNIGIGLFCENVSILKNAIKYLLNGEMNNDC